MKNIMIIAGEASGDTLGAGFVREFNRLKPGYEFFGLGGDKMKSAGVKLEYHVKDLAIFGFWEVLKNFRFIKRVQRDILRQVDAYRPGMAVLIDYPGFNLRLAPLLKKRGIKVFYYISPQIWAWGARRIEKIKKYVDFMAVIFEFEKNIYEEAGVPVEWIGHPLLDEIKVEKSSDGFMKDCGLPSGTIPVGLFPGSRQQEVSRILPEMLYALELISIGYPGVRGIIGKAPALDFGFYDGIMRQCKHHVPIYNGSNYELMAHARVNIVCSGTATLESGILGTPLVVVYKTSPVTYWIARSLIRIRNIGMVNVVAGKDVVPELIQDKCSANHIAEKTLKFLNDEHYYNSVKAELAEIRSKLGERGAAGRAAGAAARIMTQ